MTARHVSWDELARKTKRLLTATNPERPRFVGGSGDTSRDPEEVRLDALRNPMNDVGQMLYGEEDGALAALAAPTADGQVLVSTGPDMDGKFRPEWGAGTGGGTGGGPGGFYRAYLYAIDESANTWSFMSMTTGGQDYPVIGLLETE